MIQRVSMAIFCALSLTVAGAVHASSVGISPTNLIAPVGQKSQAVTITNPGDSPLRYQVRVKKWTLVDGHDVLTDTSELQASPAIVEVPPQGRRVVRVMRVAGTGSAYYRLVLEQLPDAKKPGQTGLQLLVNQSLPVAFEPVATTAPNLTATQVPGGFALTNTGTVAARLTAIGPVGEPAWRQGVLGWVFPGTTRIVPVDHQASELALIVNRKPLTVSVK